MWTYLYREVMSLQVQFSCCSSQWTPAVLLFCPALRTTDCSTSTWETLTETKPVCTVKPECSSAVSGPALPWRRWGCQHRVMGLRATVRKKTTTTTTTITTTTVTVLTSIITPVIEAALHLYRIQATFFLLRAAMVTSSSRTTGDSSSL